MEKQESRMPMEVVLIRHGQSEANVAQRADKAGEDMTPYMGVFEKHDLEQRLSPEGVEQTKKTRIFLQENGLDPQEFDYRLTSPFYRAMESAAHYGGPDCTWIPDIRLIERDWGNYGAMPIKERQERYPETERSKRLNSLLARYDGGENIIDTVYRVRDLTDTMTREMSGARVILSTHGEWAWGWRFNTERMTPDEWQQHDKNKLLRITNCFTLDYLRRNPDDPEDVRNSMSDGWLRMLNPLKPELSPYNGEFQKLPGKRHFSGAQLLDMIEAGSMD